MHQIGREGGGVANNVRSSESTQNVEWLLWCKSYHHDVLWRGDSYEQLNFTHIFDSLYEHGWLQSNIAPNLQAVPPTMVTSSVNTHAERASIWCKFHRCCLYCQGDVSDWPLLATPKLHCSKVVSVVTNNMEIITKCMERTSIWCKSYPNSPIWTEDMGC